MVKRRSLIIILLVSFIFSLGMAGNLYFLRKDLLLTDENTSEYVATIANISVWEASGNVYINIATKEYKSALIVAPVVANKLGQSFLSDLSSGDMITFRIQNRMESNLKENYMVDIVALYSMEGEYFSLNTYNELAQEDSVQSQTAALFCCFVGLATAVSCVFKLAGAWSFRKHK